MPRIKSWKSLAQPFVLAAAVAVTAASAIAAPAWPKLVHVLTVGRATTRNLSGNLADGRRLEGFALPGSCMGEFDNGAFEGKHVLYGFTVPADTDVSIAVRPRSKGFNNLAVYAYSMPANRHVLPVEGANHDDTVCHTAVRARENEAHVVNFDGKRDARNVIIGVVGDTSVNGGRFTLSISTKRD